MKRIWTTELSERIGDEVMLAGWLHRFRQLSTVSFIVLRDGRGLAQVVVDQPELVRTVASVPEESVLQIIGTVVANPQAPSGVEIHNPAVTIVSQAVGVPAFELYRPELKAQLPTILDHAAVSLRHPRRQAIARIAANSVGGFRSVLDAAGFVEIHTPKIVASATESGANVFALDYFGRPAYLAQSPQFYKQIMVGVLERVFEVGPVFRAEPHDTGRHTNEYTSLDAEMGFIEDHTSVMAIVSDVVRGMAATLAMRDGKAIARHGFRLPAVPEEIPAIHFDTARQLLSAALNDDLSNEPDLAPAHERWLGEWALQHHNSDFLFVTGYPMSKRPFYTHPEPDNSEFSNSFDLLFRGLEIVTGGQRLHRHEDYLQALSARGQKPDDLAWYLEAFRCGMPPHGGFAMGLERWVAQMTGASNIRETTLFPRDRQRVAP